MNRETPSLDASDRSLIERLAKADKGALRTLMSRHQAKVGRLMARRVADDALAEELSSGGVKDGGRQAG